ncbi:hypothetical protein C8Q79DRAFT_686268 [Trametes meyenii]|nr:hypothetical protein C8Q79DRAFT_686268 [Trametes meyenii]
MRREIGQELGQNAAVERSPSSAVTCPSTPAPHRDRQWPFVAVDYHHPTSFPQAPVRMRSPSPGKSLPASARARTRSLGRSHVRRRDHRPLTAPDSPTALEASASSPPLPIPIAAHAPAPRGPTPPSYPPPLLFTPRSRAPIYATKCPLARVCPPSPLSGTPAHPQRSLLAPRRARPTRHPRPQTAEVHSRQTIDLMRPASASHQRHSSTTSPDVSFVQEPRSTSPIFIIISTPLPEPCCAYINAPGDPPPVPRLTPWSIPTSTADGVRSVMTPTPGRREAARPDSHRRCGGRARNALAQLRDVRDDSPR